MAVSLEALNERLELFEAIALNKQEHQRWEHEYSWYDWQQEGFDSLARQVLTLAGNQVGKTLSAGYHFACDTTQDYPDGWKGFKFDHCIRALAIGIDNDQLDVIQETLFGQVTNKQFDGGWIHPEEVYSITWSRNQSGVASKVMVKGRYGLNTIYLRSYAQVKTGQGTLKFAGKIFDLIWPDEQPPDELVGQLAIRLINGNRGKGGYMRYTMTPELGKTQLIQKFVDERGKNQHLIGPVSWDECTHMTPQAQEAALEGIPEFEHDLRRRGIPTFGSGMVYPIAEGRIRCDPFEIPEYWRCIRAMDLGITNPTAIVWLAFDPDTDTIYLVRTYSVAGQQAAVHAIAANTLWSTTSCVMPHDYDTAEKGSGELVSRFYEKAGLKHVIQFKNDDGSILVEPGLFDIYERMKDGRFKVFANCMEFWREFRLYHRDKGKVVKENDHVMDAVRYGSVMVGRYGATISGRIIKPKVIRAMKGKSYRT